LEGKAEGKSEQGRPILRWEDNSKIDLREIGRGGMEWIDLAEDWNEWRTLMNIVMNHQVSQYIGKFLSSWATGSF
jgi:hypothetical protein